MTRLDGGVDADGDGAGVDQDDGEDVQLERGRKPLRDDPRDRRAGVNHNGGPPVEAGYDVP